MKTNRNCSPEWVRIIRKAGRFFAAGWGLLLLGGWFAPVCATDVWRPHLTSAAGWKTTIAVFNPAYYQADLGFVGYDPAGNIVRPRYDLMIAPRAWCTIPTSLLPAEGSLNILSLDT